jgi:hypothetical protein
MTASHRMTASPRTIPLTRPPGAPAYYLGRPAYLWLAAHGPIRRRNRPAGRTAQPPAA